MKKTYKGLTLVEVLVSIAVFTIISLAMFSSLLAMTKVVALQEDYARIEMACYDMNAYWDMYGDTNIDQAEDNDWYRKYFGSDAVWGVGYLKYQNGQLVPTNDPNPEYIVTYDYSGTDNGLRITSVRSESKDREYLSGSIDCGSRYSVPKEDGGT